MSNDNNRPSTRKIAAGAVGAAVVGTTAGVLTYKSKADNLVDQLMDEQSDYYHDYLQKLRDATDPAVEKKLMEDHEKLMKEAKAVVDSPEFRSKATALRNRSIDYSTVISSRHGLEHLEVPELVESMHIEPAKVGEGFVAKVMLNETGLSGITPQIAKEKCMTGVKFNAHGVATEGGFIIHHIPRMPQVYMSVANEERAIHEVPSSQFDRLGNWIKGTEKSLEEVELYVDQSKSRDFTKIFRESASNGWCWKHLPKSEKFLIGGMVIAGTVVGGILGSKLVHSKHQKRELERQREATQATSALEL